jgi:predicted nucleic acid-binding Zn ribbon protein
MGLHPAPPAHGWGIMSPSASQGPAERACERCGAGYTPSSPNQRFCTPECRGGTRVVRPRRRCDICGIEFQPRVANQRFCGDACRAAHMVSLKPVLPTITCAFCGQEFTPRLATQWFCQEACRIAAQKLQVPAPIGRRSCAVCGAKFRPHTKTQVVCSERCKKLDEARRAREMRFLVDSGAKRIRHCCPVCGTRFAPTDLQQECCSARCAEDYLELRRRMDCESSLHGAPSEASLNDADFDGIARVCCACGLEQVGASFPKGQDVCFDCIEHERRRRAWLERCQSCTRPIRGEQKCRDCSHLASVARQGALARAFRNGFIIACEHVRPHAVWARDGYLCHICGLPTLETGTPGLQPVLDHVRPVVSGGSHTMDNLRCAHVYCNLAKSDSMRNPDTRRHVVALIAGAYAGPSWGADEGEQT